MESITYEIAQGKPGRLRVRQIVAGVQKLHQMPHNNNAVFQVASQFNFLEMTGPSVRPNDGVDRYSWGQT